VALAVFKAVAKAAGLSATTAMGVVGFGPLVLMVACGLGAYTYILQRTSEFAITDRRFVAKTGIISRRSAELLLTRVESIRVDQSIIGRLLGYGTLVIVGTGGGLTPYRRIADPMSFRAAAQRLLDETADPPQPAARLAEAR
jgi:uncharacterized membrane protein YdbT with pleckstrin-like domain